MTTIMDDPLDKKVIISKKSSRLINNFVLNSEAVKWGYARGCEIKSSTVLWEEVRWDATLMIRIFLQILNQIELIQNSTENIEFKIWIRGRIWPLNLNLCKFHWQSNLIKNEPFGRK